MEKDDNNFYTNGHDYNYMHTENTETNGIRKKDDNNFFFIYEWTSLQLQTHGKYKQSREILNQKSVKVNACESLELSSSLVAMVKI